jgi:hypothetical protein
MTAQYGLLVVIVLSALSLSSLRPANAALVQGFFSDTNENFEFRFTWTPPPPAPVLTPARGAQDAQAGAQWRALVEVTNNFMDFESRHLVPVPNHLDAPMGDEFRKSIALAAFVQTNAFITLTLESVEHIANPINHSDSNQINFRRPIANGPVEVQWTGVHLQRPVPEPGTFGLFYFAIAATGAALWRCHRRK